MIDNSIIMSKEKFYSFNPCSNDYVNIYFGSISADTCSISNFIDKGILNDPNIVSSENALWVLLRTEFMPIQDIEIFDLDCIQKVFDILKNDYNDSMTLVIQQFIDDKRAYVIDPTNNIFVDMPDAIILLINSMIDMEDNENKRLSLSYLCSCFEILYNRDNSKRNRISVCAAKVISNYTNTSVNEEYIWQLNYIKTNYMGV